MGDEDDTDELVDDSKKSERKRQRERQRRSDIANAFEELSSLLSQIDPDESENASSKRKRRKSGEPVEADVDASGMTRLDLIGRTAEVLRKLQRENDELRRKLEENRRSGGDDKEVLVMVPTLSPADPDHGSISSRSAPYPPYYFSQSHPPMEYRPPPSSQDYYGSRGPLQPHSFPPYPGHPHQGWPGHPPPPTPPAPPGSIMSQQQPPSASQYPPGHQTSHPHQIPNQYGSHSSSPQRSHAHSFNQNLDPSGDHLRDSS